MSLRRMMMSSNGGYAWQGLILHYDGINNTGEGHSNHSGFWCNLVNGKNAIVNSPVWNENSLVTSSTTWAAGDSAYLPENTPFTAEITLRITSLTGKSYLVFLSQYTSGNIGRTYIGSNNQKLIVRLGSTVINSNFELELNKDYHITLRRAGNRFSLYVDGGLIASYTQSFILQQTPTVVCGMDSYEVNGYVYAVRVYNRALTDEEITFNYGVDKKRFGLSGM